MNLMQQSAVPNDDELVDLARGVDVSIVKEEDVYEIYGVTSLPCLVVSVQVLIHAVSEHVLTGSV